MSNEASEARGQEAEFIPSHQPGALEAISRAEIDVQISTAKRYPRNIALVKKSMLDIATLDQETAEACFYTIPRGGKSIQGPSVRLAEIALSCFGNIKAGSRVIETNAEGDHPHVIVQSVCLDLQNNVSVSIEKRRRITKKKSKSAPDEDDINLATNACAAIALRDAIFKVVPLALIKPVYEAAKKVAVGDQKTLAERRGKCIDTFAKLGVSKERILASLDKKDVEEIGLEDLGNLIGLFNSIKDGETKIDEAFPDPKFNTQKAPVPDPNDHPPGLEPKAPGTAAAPSNVVQMPAPAAEGLTEEQLEAKAKQEQGELAKKKAEAATAAAKPAEITPAKTEPPKDPAKPKITIPPWNSAEHKPALREKMKEKSLTEAQLCGYLKSAYMVDGCLTIDDVECSAPSLLALVLAKFETIWPKISEQPGKSAQ